MKLQYDVSTPEIEEIKERILSLSLAHKIELIPSKKTPAIVSGKEVHNGIEAINKHIDLIASEASQWYYCDC